MLVVNLTKGLRINSIIKNPQQTTNRLVFSNWNDENFAQLVEQLLHLELKRKMYELRQQMRQNKETLIIRKYLMNGQSQATSVLKDFHTVRY